jgi:P27 family predicted phage terminase small subunit
MKRGRKPKPSYLKIVDGNRGKRRINSLEPKLRIPEQLTCPVRLDADGLKFWKHFATLLRDLRVLSEADLHSLAAGAQWWSVYQRAMRSLAKKLTIESEANGEVARPGVAIARQAFSAAWTIMASFGLNPGDRGRLHTITPGDDETSDPASEFFDHAQKYFR